MLFIKSVYYPVVGHYGRLTEKPVKKPPSARTAAPQTAVVTAVSPPVVSPEESLPAFPVVGLGASAGGLEAIEEFLKKVPDQCGAAFVIVQHLDPSHECVLPELLQRITAMPVVQVADQTPVRPNCVYVIPPNKDLSLLHGVLHLLEPAGARGLRLPIDFFFRSLAQDLREHSIGVILSGMGSDGTVGLRAIKEQGGVGLVQDPAAAKFPGMPRSAMDAGLGDIVAPAAELPARLLQYWVHRPRFARRDGPAEDDTKSHLEKVVILLRNRTRHDFSLYKPNTLYRRIERRMGLHQIPRMATYVRYLRENPQEIDLLFKELLIGVTGFFRDPAAWEQLGRELPATLLANHPAGDPVRAWVPGCSTGEEAYSLAMLFKETVEPLKARGHFTLQIFATDLDRDAVDKARQGFFPAGIAADVSPERLARFFKQEEHGYRVTKEIREMVIFAPQNLIMDPPFTKLDVLSCRNLLIYLTPELQKKVFPLFHYSLNPGGLLFLGNAESIGNFTGLFAPVHAKFRLFRRKEIPTRSVPVDFPSAFVTMQTKPPLPATSPALSAASLQKLAERWLLQFHAPAAVLVNDQGDILFVSGRTGRYLEPAAGKANWNVFAMARDGLRPVLNDVVAKARQQNETVTARNCQVGTNGGTHYADVSVCRLQTPEPLRGLFMMVFAEVPGPRPAGKGRTPKALPASDRVRELEQELQAAREEIQTAREEFQTSQEELKSMNEEMQSTNEELQSTNEELTTSKEEMQSLNEELQTVNAELQAKVDELSTASNDMKNLLNSTQIATLFLDGALLIRRFTEQAAKIIKFIPGDIGRPVTDLSSELLYPDLTAHAQEVLRTLMPLEKEVNTTDGRWFASRIMPYRTMDNRINGVVITFNDISAAKKLEAELRAAGVERRPEK